MPLSTFEPLAVDRDEDAVGVNGMRPALAISVRRTAAGVDVGGNDGVVGDGRGDPCGEIDLDLVENLGVVGVPAEEVESRESCEGV